MRLNKVYSYGWLIWALGALFYCYEYFLRISPEVFAGQLMHSYGLGGAALGNLVAFYYYAYTPMQIPVGILMDKYGPRLLLTLAVFCCALGSFLFAATPYFWVAALGRFFVGFGSAFAFVGVLKLATIWLPADKFAFVVGLATSLGMVGAMVGENLLTFLLTYFGWRHITYAAAFAGIILAILIWSMVRNKVADTIEVIDYTPINLQEILYSLGKALSHRQIWLVGIIGGCIYLPTSVFAELWGVPYLEQARHFTVVQANFAISMIFLGWAIGGPTVGYISDKIHLRKLPIIFGGIFAALLMTVLLFTANIPLLIVYVMFLIFGVFSGVQTLTFALARESCAANIAGTAVAVNNMFVMFGGMVLQPLVGKMLDDRWSGVMHSGHRVFSNANYEHTLVILPICLGIAVILTCLIKETHATSSEAPEFVSAATKSSDIVRTKRTNM